MMQSKQQDTGERLDYPDGRNNMPSGYETLAHNILQFCNLGSIPLNIDIARLDDGSGISQTLQSNDAGWHKSCRLLFCTMKLQRVQKRAEKRKQETGNLDSPSPDKMRGSPRNTRSSPEVCTQPVCFFCDKTNEKESTANIDATVRECATELSCETPHY